jgi:hypothetical protein
LACVARSRIIASFFHSPATHANPPQVRLRLPPNTSFQRHAFLLPQFLLLAQQLHAVGLGSFRLARALN